MKNMAEGSPKIPMSRNYINRLNINRLMDDAFSSPYISVISVTAGAGFGKSCTIAHYIGEKDIVSAWFQISSLDNLSLRWWKRFAGLFIVDPEMAVALKKMDFPATLFSFHMFLDVFSAYLNKIGTVFTIVFDDLHLLKNTEIINFIEHLIDANLHNLKIITITRRAVSFRRGLLLRTDCINIEEADFRFTLQETEDFIHTHCNNISSTDISTIFNDTQGWIFGLQLLASSLNKSNNVYSKFNFYDLMEKELFGNFSSERQRLLIQMSLIGTIPQGLMQKLLEFNDLDLDIISELAFFVRFDKSNWVYYTHHLFSDFLKKKKCYLSPKEMGDIYLLSADWFFENGFDLDALRCYQRCNEYEKITEIMSAYLVRLSKELNDFFLEVLDEIPEGIFIQKPMLRVLYALYLLNSVQIEKADQQLSYLMNHYENESSRQNNRELLGEAYIVSALICMGKRDDCFADHFIKAAEYLPNGSKLITKSLPLNGCNFANIVKDSKPGEFERMEQLILKSMPYASKVMNGSGYGVEYLVVAEGAYHIRELKVAEQNAYQALYMAKQYEQHDIECMAYFYLLKIIVFSGNYSKVSSFNSEFEAHISNNADMHDFTVFDIVKGWFFAAIGETERISKWILSDYENERFLSPLSSGIDKLVRARCLLAKKNYEELLALVESIQNIYGISEFLLGHLEIAILKAIAYHYLSNPTDSAKYLYEAYVISISNNLTMLFIEFGRHMRTLTSSALKMGDIGIPQEWLTDIHGKSASYAKQIAAIRTGYNLATGKGQLGIESLTKKEFQILTHLSNGLTNKQIAESCNISPSTVKSVLDKIYDKIGAQNRIDAIKITLNTNATLADNDD